MLVFFPFDPEFATEDVAGVDSACNLLMIGLIILL